MESKITPATFAEFKKLARKGNLIPVYSEYLADLETPVSLFLKTAAKEKSCFLLESAEQEDKIGRYSFIGSHPLAVIEAKDHEDASRLLEKKIKDFRLASADKIPPLNGFVGFFSYENVSDFEKIKLQKKPGVDFPRALFMLPSRIMVFDHFKRTIKVIVFCRAAGRKSLKSVYAAAIRTIHQIEKDLASQQKTKIKPVFLSSAPEKKKLKSNLSAKQFKEQVRHIKKYIHQGDCIQVVFSQRFDLGKITDEFEVYRSLRAVNPSPYMFFYRHKNICLIGSSPEVLVKKTGGEAEVRPIAGTRRRGKDEAEDARLEKELCASKKELAEHLMLVDLGRNDLGRVCQFNSVKVEDFCHVEYFSHVMHLVSRVRGKLKPGQNAFSLLRAAFPAGTVTGAPKVRAMEIIDETEKTARGPYAGCLGYFNLSGDMDMCITIRTIAVRDKRAYVQAGAGIVYDSDPEMEYQETLNKARALFKAVSLSRKK